MNDDLISAREVAAILSKNAGREISVEYVRVLASPRYRKLTAVPIDGRTNLYHRSEAEKLIIQDKPGRKKKASTD